MKIIKNLSDEMTAVAVYPWYDEEEAEKGYSSVTGLLNPVRIFHLKRRHKEEIIRKASDIIVPAFGNMFHNGMQAVLEKKENYITEIRMITPFEVMNQTIMLSGKFDCLKINRFKIGKFEEFYLKLIDWKETSVFSLSKKDTLQKWTQQLNMYRFMIMHPNTQFLVPDKRAKKEAEILSSLLREDKLEIKTLEVQYRARDWRKGEAFRNKLTHLYYPGQTGIVEIEILSDEIISTFIKTGLANFINCENTEDAALPLCSPEERWQRTADYAVYKGTSSRASKVFKTTNYSSTKKTREAAELYIVNHAKGKEMKVVKRETESKRCLEYCDVCEFCPFYKSLMQQIEGARYEH